MCEREIERGSACVCERKRGRWKKMREIGRKRKIEPERKKVQEWIRGGGCKQG